MSSNVEWFGTWSTIHWFVVATANNSPHAMRARNTHIHPLTKLWRALVQTGPLKGMFSEFFKLAEIVMIHVRSYILRKSYFNKVSHAFCIHVFECMLASYQLTLSHCIHFIGFWECRTQKNSFQCFFLEEQTPQSLNWTFTSCYNNVCTKRLHIDIIPVQGSRFRLESLQTEVRPICIWCLICIE